MWLLLARPGVVDGSLCLLCVLIIMMLMPSCRPTSHWMIRAAPSHTASSHPCASQVATGPDRPQTRFDPQRAVLAGTVGCRRRHRRRSQFKVPATHTCCSLETRRHYQALLYMYAFHREASASSDDATTNTVAMTAPPAQCLPSTQHSFSDWHACVSAVTAALGEHALRCDCPFVDQSAAVSYENLYYRGDRADGVELRVTFLRVGRKFRGLHLPAGWLPPSQRPARHALPPYDAALQYVSHSADVFADGVLASLGCVDDVVVALPYTMPMYYLEGRQPHATRLSFLRAFQRLLCHVNSTSSAAADEPATTASATAMGGVDADAVNRRTPVWLTTPGSEVEHGVSFDAEWSGLDVAVELGWRVLDRRAIDLILSSPSRASGGNVFGGDADDGTADVSVRSNLKREALYAGWHRLLANILAHPGVSDTVSRMVIRPPSPATLRPVEPLPGGGGAVDHHDPNQTAPTTKRDPNRPALSYPDAVRWAYDCLYSAEAMEHGRWIGRPTAHDGESDSLRYEAPAACGNVSIGRNLSAIAAALTGRHVLFIGDSVLRFQVGCCLRSGSSLVRLDRV